MNYHNSKLPILISIPHGGYYIPEELELHNNMSMLDIYYDSDFATNRIYNLDNTVAKQVSAKVARCFIDLNRSPEQIGLNHPDGLFKQFDLQGKPIFKNSWFPDQKLQSILLKKWYYPYHAQLINPPDELELIIDCHSMLPYTPTFNTDNIEITSDKKSFFTDNPRPDICLGNLGNSEGIPIGGNKTSCPQHLIMALKSALNESFKNQDIEIALNQPFSGGYITKNVSNNSKLPIIQLEINRKLYNSFDKNTLNNFDIINLKVQELNKKIEQAIKKMYAL